MLGQRSVGVTTVHVFSSGIILCGEQCLGTVQMFSTVRVFITKRCSDLGRVNKCPLLSIMAVHLYSTPPKSEHRLGMATPKNIRMTFLDFAFIGYVVLVLSIVICVRIYL